MNKAIKPTFAKVIKLIDYKLTKREREVIEANQRAIVACDQYWGKSKPPPDKAQA